MTQSKQQPAPGFIVLQSVLALKAWRDLYYKAPWRHRTLLKPWTDMMWLMWADSWTIFIWWRALSSNVSLDCSDMIWLVCGGIDRWPSLTTGHRNKLKRALVVWVHSAWHRLYRWLILTESYWLFNSILVWVCLLQPNLRVFTEQTSTGTD